MELCQLIYVSRASRAFSHADLRALLESAVRFNECRGITGLLLYAGGTFMQVLEGTEGDVDATMERIRRDARHHDINVLSKSAVPAREFGRWSMGLHEVDAEDIRSLPAYAPFFEAGFSPERIGAKPGLALSILQVFANERL